MKNVLIIKIPEDNLPERRYIINVLLSDFLGLEYTILSSPLYHDYTLLFDGTEIIIKDVFWKEYKDDLSYLTKDAFPRSAFYARNRFTFEDDIPVIYGNDKCELSGKKLICGIDIFASSFFMLTRWEEFVNKKRDKHNRFVENESYAWKNNLLSRPLVNEYVEMLWNMLVGLGFAGERKKRSYELILTHDVDALTYVSYRTVLGDLIKRKKLSLAWKSLKFTLGKDPFDIYDFLMSISEKLGIKSHFYFMSTDSKREYDTSWYVKRKKFHSIIKDIKSRGHIIGFHPGYYTYDNPQRWRYEKSVLEDAIKQEVDEGRQHFLRISVPGTLEIWENNNMKIDSTLGYSGKEGFRCGTGDAFHVFDFLERKQLRLKERPLVVMDGTLKTSRNYSDEEAKEIVRSYILTGRKYKMAITFLFHNSSFFGIWEGYDDVYKEVLRI